MVTGHGNAGWHRLRHVPTTRYRITAYNRGTAIALKLKARPAVGEG